MSKKDIFVMRKETIIRVVCDILIVALLFGFVLSWLWYINGSLEMMPTEEQEDKAKTGALLLMTAFGLPGIVCIAVRIKHRKR